MIQIFVRVNGSKATPMEVNLTAHDFHSNMDVIAEMKR